MDNLQTKSKSKTKMSNSQNNMRKSLEYDMQKSMEYKEATKTIITSDVLVMNVNVGTPQTGSVDCYSYFDEFEQEYFLCGGVRKGTDLNAELFKYFCQSRKSLLSMLDSVVEPYGECIELKLVNYPNLFIENEYIDYNLLDTKFKKFGVGSVSTSAGDVSVTYNIDDYYNKVLCPSVITHMYYDDYTDDTYFMMKKYAKLLKNVRW